ncbi:MAG: hypothetical protein ACRD0L_06220 [Acidimicrobiales bacterium]
MPGLRPRPWYEEARHGLAVEAPRWTAAKVACVPLYTVLRLSYGACRLAALPEAWALRLLGPALRAVGRASTSWPVVARPLLVPPVWLLGSVAIPVEMIAATFVYPALAFRRLALRLPGVGPGMGTLAFWPPMPSIQTDDR